MRICSFPGCGRPHGALGLCKTHWAQQRKGKPLMPVYSTQRVPGTPPVIAWDEVPCPREDLEGPCYIFRKGKDSGGYGEVKFGPRMVRVHVYVWIQANGPVPEGLFVDHQCRNRACCNINHLRLVTPKISSTENVEGAQYQLNAAKTHCPRGHPYDEANTIRRPPKLGNPSGGRDCKACRDERYRLKRLRKKAESGNNINGIQQDGIL